MFTFHTIPTSNHTHTAPSGVGSVSLSVSTSSSLSLTWSLPNVPNGLITQYYIQATPALPVEGHTGMSMYQCSIVELVDSLLLTENVDNYNYYIQTRHSLQVQRSLWISQSQSRAWKLHWTAYFRSQAILLLFQHPLLQEQGEGQPSI